MDLERVSKWNNKIGKRNNDEIGKRNETKRDGELVSTFSESQTWESRFHWAFTKTVEKIVAVVSKRFKFHAFVFPSSSPIQHSGCLPGGCESTGQSNDEDLLALGVLENIDLIAFKVREELELRCELSQSHGGVELDKFEWKSQYSNLCQQIEFYGASKRSQGLN